MRIIRKQKKYRKTFNSYSLLLTLKIKIRTIIKVALKMVTEKKIKIKMKITIEKGIIDIESSLQCRGGREGT